MLKRISYSVLLVCSTSAIATGTGGYNDLQLNSVDFVRATCVGLGGPGSGSTVEEMDLADTCGSMLQSIGGSGGLDRALGNEELAGGFQNVISEETISPISIASNTSSLGLAAINARLQKIVSGGGAGDDFFSNSNLGFFLTGMGGFGDTDQTSFQNASDFETKGIISGFDYKLSENLIVGVAGSYSNFELDFDQNVDVSGGGVESDTYSVTAYSNYSVGNGYVEGVFTYGWSDYDIERSIFIGSNTAVAVVDRTAIANPDGEQFSASLAAGYDFHTAGFSYGPYIMVAYFESEIDAYDETGALGLNLRVGEHKSDSLETVLGIQMSHAISQSFGVLVPHVKAAWHHEYKNSQRSFDIQYVNDPNNNIYKSFTGSPDRNFFDISAGLSADLKYGFQAFFDYQTLLGINNLDFHKFSAGLRMEF